MADGDTITAALFNDEFNRLLTAFSYASSSTTGHQHDGTAGEGGNIHTIGDQDFLNKILTTSNTWEFYVEVSSAAAKQMVLQDGALVPNADSDLDLGTSSKYFKDAYIDSITTTGNVSVGGNLTVTGTTTFNGGTLTLGDAADDNVVFGADVNSNIIPNTDSAYDLGSSSQEWRDLYIDGTAYLDAINFNGTAISATAAEINILDGVTATASELNIMDGVTATTAELNILDGVTSTASELNILDGVTSSTAELNILDGVTSTTAELNLLDGVTATTAELNILDGVTSTAAELNILDGVTSTAAELNTLDGVTAVVGELNYLDLGSTAVGTAIASKAVVLDSNKDYTGIRNLTLSGDLTISGDDLTMGTNTSGHLLIADGTNFNPTAVGDLSEISTVANDDVLLAVDTSGGGLKKIARSTLVSGLASSGAISNVADDSTPQLGGDLDLNGQDIVTTSNATLDLAPNGTGTVVVRGNTNSGAIVFNCENNSHGQKVYAQPHSAGVTNNLMLPAGANSTLVSRVSTDTLTNKTLTSPKINEDVAVSATATEINLLDGVTATTAELNILDGVTSTAAELNILDGVTSTAAELNILDGVTSSTAELNILDAVSRGSLIYGNSSGATALLTKGSASTVLTSDGTDISWAAPAASGVTYVTKTANYTTQDLEGVLANTSGGAFTVTLPASPSAGAQVIVADSGDAFGTNNLTVARNGETIDGTAANLVLDITGVSVQFVYNGSTWRVYAQVGGKGGTAVNTTATQTLTNKTLTSAVLNTGVSGTAVLDEDNMASNSATKLATQQSIKAYVDSQVDSTEFVLEDDDGTEVTVSNAKEVKFIGSGITTNWTDTDNGTDGDPYDLTFTVDAAQTGITSLLATDIKIGEDDETKIDFETADEIHFYANNVEQVYLGDNIFGPQSDSDVDLGSSSVRWKDAYVDSITVTGEVDAASLDISGNVDVDGTLETDNLTIGGAQGSDGQVLTSTGSGVAWENAAAGGTSGMQVLSTVTASNSATVDLETTFDSTYDDYIIMISDYVPATDGTDLYMQYKIGGSYQSSSSSYNTVYVYNYHSSSSISIENTGGTTSYIMVARYLGNAYNEVGQFKVTLSNVHDTGRATPAYCYGSAKNAGGESQGGFSHGIDANGGAVTGVRFKSSTGNITSGNFRLYGVAKS